SAPPGKEKLCWFRDYLKTQVAKAKVKVRLGTEITTPLVQKENPDVVIIATGAKPLRPKSFAKDIPTAWDVLGGKVAITNKRVIRVGGGMVGVETAEYLVHQGNCVTVVEMLPKLAADMEMHNRFGALQALKEAGATMLPNKEVVKVTKKGVATVDKESGKEAFIDGEVVIVAVGAAPQRDLADALEEKVSELYTVGDCNEPRIIMEAVYEGSRVARRI
ncbi:MAG: FAD-dependent oxidoreductase, partial [Chloroflexota bacterium]